MHPLISSRLPQIEGDDGAITLGAARTSSAQSPGSGRSTTFDHRWQTPNWCPREAGLADRTTLLSAF